MGNFLENVDLLCDLADSLDALSANETDITTAIMEAVDRKTDLQQANEVMRIRMDMESVRWQRLKKTGVSIVQ